MVGFIISMCASWAAICFSQTKIANEDLWLGTLVI